MRVQKYKGDTTNVYLKKSTSHANALRDKGLGVTSMAQSQMNMAEGKLPGGSLIHIQSLALVQLWA